MQNKKKVLVVDDQKSFASFLGEGLVDEEGYEVATVFSGDEAMKRLREAQFDLVITDVIMPDMSGIELLKEIRETAPNTKVVVMTAYGSPEVQKKMAELKVDGYLEKPFTVAKLRESVKHLLVGLVKEASGDVSRTGVRKDLGDETGAMRHEDIAIRNKKKVLVVDDQKSFASFLSETLTVEGGYEVVMVFSGNEAMKRLREAKFDLVITDVIMPDMSGMELLQAIRETAPGTKIIVMTAYGSSEIQKKLDELKVDGYLEKPFTVAKLRESVKRLLVGLLEEASGDVNMVDVRGDLDGDTVTVLRERIAQFVAEGQKDIVVDMSDVKSVDTAGVSGLISVLKSVRRSEGKIRLVKLQPSVAKIFEALRIAKLFDIQSEEKIM